ncbi:MAG TPA: TetR/AcrR family transcriptional regulator [Acidimicrobiales bacterium]|jgi:AcrR family transcriptional regulator
MPASTPTKERIIDEAMRLFGQQGYRGTSVAQIEQAAGLTPGAGGLYHHFTSKEQLLAAGIERHLARLDALRDIRRVLTNLGDLRAELAVTARYFLAELDSQVELFRLLISEVRAKPSLLTDAADQLIASTYRSFTEWIQSASNHTLSDERAAMVATLTLGSLLSTRFVSGVLGIEAIPQDDDALVAAWVDMVMATLEISPPA